MKRESFYANAPDGAKIFVNRWIPDEGIKIRAAIITIHGALTPSRRWENYGERMTTYGYVCYNHDQRGYDRSILTPEPTEQVICGEDGFNHMVDDVHLIYEQAQKDYPGLPIFLLGHSMGSWIARGYAERYQGLAGLLLSGGNNQTDGCKIVAAWAKQEIKELGRDAMSPVAGKLSSAFYMGELSKHVKVTCRADFLTSDPAEIEKFNKTPAVYGRGYSCGWVLDANEFVLQINRPEEVAKIPASLPVRIFTGTLDTSAGFGEGPRSVMTEFINIAKVQDISMKLYEGARHEMFNELKRDIAYADVSRWIDEHI